MSPKLRKLYINAKHFSSWVWIRDRHLKNKAPFNSNLNLNSKLFGHFCRKLRILGWRGGWAEQDDTKNHRKKQPEIAVSRQELWPFLHTLHCLPILASRLLGSWGPPFLTPLSIASQCVSCCGCQNTGFIEAELGLKREKRRLGEEERRRRREWGAWHVAHRGRGRKK